MVSHGVLEVVVVTVTGGFSIDIGFSMMFIPTMIGFVGQGFGNRGHLSHLHRWDIAAATPAKGAALVKPAKPTDVARIAAIANPDFVGKHILFLPAKSCED
jgi:hypothetical protein